MANWIVKKDSTGIWRSDDCTEWNIHEERAATLKVVELDAQELWKSFCEKQRSPCREPNPWWCCGTMPTHCEIKQAISQGKLQCARNDDDQHLGDRGWHIERVAYLAKSWNDRDPIRMKSVKDMEIDDGAHRLMAAFYLQKKRILAYEKPRPPSA